MTSQYISGKKVSPLDAQITRIFNECEDMPVTQGMTIGIENEDGDLYRMLYVFGPLDYLSVVESLCDLGFKDLHAGLAQMSPDSRFSHPIK
jgi:hypothetical protein